MANRPATHARRAGHDSDASPRAMRVALAVTLVAIGGVVVHVAWPSLKIDSVVVALLVLAALPWLGDILESIEFPGGGSVKYRRALQRTNQRVDNLEAAVEESADRAGEFAASEQLVTPLSPAPSASPASDAVAPEPAPGVDVASPSDDLDVLISQYNRTRAEQPSGFKRTAAMTQIVTAMRLVGQRLPALDWEPRLSSRDGGVRLSAYAYLCERPTCAAATPLVRALVGGTESKPFGQYWALKALRRVLGECDPETARRVEPDLRQYRTGVGPGTDREREATAILNELAAR